MRHALTLHKQKCGLVCLVLSLLVFGIAASAQDTADAFVSIKLDGVRLNRATNTFDTTATITNTSTDTTLAAPMSLVVLSVSDPTVSLANMTGRTSDGFQYVDIPLANGLFNPKSVISSILLKFNNPNRLAFSYTLSLRATINGPPGPAPAPTIYITSPAMGTLFGAQPIAVSGTINDNGASVTVNGVAATVANGQFTATVPLIRDGIQTLTAVAINKSGAVSQSSITIGLESTPPSVVVDSPVSGASTVDSGIEVAGTYNDPISPTVAITVNNVPAFVMNGHFSLPNVPLNLGGNAITVRGTNAVGKVSVTTLTVNRIAANTPHLIIISGQGQSGLVGSLLPAPLVVRYVDAAGNAVPNLPVSFQVDRGDGVLDAAGDRLITIRTDSSGLASTSFQLGVRIGAGNNRVMANALGSSLAVEFCANALPLPADRINIIALSNQQTGIVNRPLEAPFQAVVSDKMGNPVANAVVTFQVTEGGGSLGGASTLNVTTGANGVASALLTLGPNSGTENNTVKATIPATAVPGGGFLAVRPAVTASPVPTVQFAASAVVTGPLANTTVSGIILDNQNQPLMNVKVSIVGTLIQGFTDSRGSFRLTGVPAGAQRLFYDGTTVLDTAGRLFPTLETDINVFSGADNTLKAPVYLPTISADPKSAATITGIVTDDIVLKMNDVPEATLTLHEGTRVYNDKGDASPTNPITVRFSRVNIDRIPMPPSNGGKFLIAFTTQPSGTHFDPPAQICLPNVGATPGAQVDIFNFDHRIGQFVSVGLATVSEDGATLCSNPGYGIALAGWGGCGTPPTPNTNCQNCRVELNVASSVLTLCKNNILTTKVTSDKPPTSYTFEIKRTGSGSWFQLASGAADTYAWTVRVAGKFKLRVTIMVDGKPCQSSEQDLEIQFPSYAEVVADADVATATKAAWDETIAATTPTKRREEGFWIRLNTKSCKYEFTTTIIAPLIGNDVGGSVDIGSRPADSNSNPDPNADCIYTVASFHTHTPTTYRTGDFVRPVGPSDADQRIDTSDDVTGVVYDYVESPAGSGSIPFGHPLNSAAKLYHSGPTRRTKP